jgi:hypothetical protein
MYQLNHFRNTYDTYNYHTFGAGIFARFKPIKQIVIQSELNAYNTDLFNSLIPNVNRVNVSAFLTGAGYTNQLGNRAFYQIVILYDFIDDPSMPLRSAVFSRFYLKMGLFWYLG